MIQISYTTMIMFISVIWCLVRLICIGAVLASTEILVFN